MSSDPARRREDDRSDEGTIYELDRYRRGFENLERQVRILDRERQKLAVVLNNAPVGFLILDNDLRLTWANSMVSTSFGRTPERRMIGRPCHEVLCHQETVCEACPARKALNGSSPSSLEVKADIDGQARRWYVTAAQIRSPFGMSEEILVMIQDLTDLEMLRRSEASLSGQKEILERIARGAPLPDVLNAICRKVESEAPGMDCAINILDADTPAFRAGAPPALPDSHLWSTPILGAEERVLGTFALHFHQPGSPDRHHLELIETYTHLARIAMERDLAAGEKAHLEEQLRQSQKMEAIGTLAGGVAHDFNNLMTGVLGYVSLLREFPSDPERVLKAAAVIENAGRRAADLTSKLLGFARKGRYQCLPVNMNEIIEEVAALLGRTIDKKIELVVEPAAEEPWIQGDPAQIHQVLLNLTVNARDAMPDGGRLTLFTRVESSPEAPGQYCVVTGVRDTGPGIPPEIQDRIFEPFFTTKETGKGSGMGLATAYGIVHSHGGELLLDSPPGRGATFHFRLPRLRPAAGTPPPAGQATALPPDGSRPADSEAPEAEAGARPPRILVIDDDEAVRELCADVLSDLGYEVVKARDGIEGLEIYRREPERIDLVVLDMIMPRMNGRECFQELRLINAKVRAVLVTGFAQEEIARELSDEGMIGFLQKPYEMSQLANLVSAALGCRR